MATVQGDEGALSHGVLPATTGCLIVIRWAAENEVSIMSAAKEEVKALLDKLPDDCSLADIQYHLYVVEKIRRGMECAETEGVVGHEDVERKFGRWTSK